MHTLVKKKDIWCVNNFWFNNIVFDGWMTWQSCFGIFTVSISIRTSISQTWLLIHPQHEGLTATDATTTSPTTSAESTRGTAQEEAIEVNRRVTAISNQIIPLRLRQPFTSTSLSLISDGLSPFPPFSSGSVDPHYDHQRGELLDLTRTITVLLFRLFIIVNVPSHFSGSLTRKVLSYVQCRKHSR